jgi:hypothetical protein
VVQQKEGSFTLPSSLRLNPNNLRKRNPEQDSLISSKGSQRPDLLKERSRKLALLLSCCLFALCPAFPHSFRDALAAFRRKPPLFTTCGLCGLGCSLCRLFRGCGPARTSAARLVTSKQVARVLQASYLLVDADQYFFYFHVPSL